MAAFIGLAVGPLLVVGVVLAWQSLAVQKKQAVELQHEVAQRASAHVSSFITDVETRLSTTLADIGSAGHDDDDHLRSSLSRLLAQHDVFEELALIDHRGRPVPPASIALCFS